jgi:hypothetical protein
MPTSLRQAFVLSVRGIALIMCGRSLSISPQTARRGTSMPEDQTI